MKADSWNAKTFQDSIEQEPTTQIESNRAEYRLPAKDVLSSTESAEVVKLLQSLTLYTSNRNLYDSIFGEGELLLELRSPITVDLFLERYQPYDRRLISAKKHRFTVLQLSPEKFYVGEVFNGKCHGVGVVVFRDGRLYEGLLENNIRQGEGLFVLPDRSWYYGQFSNDKKDGFGTELTGRYRYQGQYVNGMKHGHGVLVEGTTTYVGQWEMGLISGKGVLQTSDSRYEGSFVGFKKHGMGRQHFTNGDEYTGTYSEGKPHGQGEYHWTKDECHFIGSFAEGNRCGKGEWISSTGNRYLGNYENDLKNGYGEFYWLSGNVYKGNYQHDLRHGYGEMYWRDGCVYKGDWLNGIQHGRGIMLLPGGGTLTGLFEQNILVSKESVVSSPQQKRQIGKSKSYQKESFRRKYKRVDSTHENTREHFPVGGPLYRRTDVLLLRKKPNANGKKKSRGQTSRSRSKEKRFSQSKQLQSSSKDKHELSPGGGHHRFCRACAVKGQISAVDLRPSQKKLPAMTKKHKGGVLPHPNNAAKSSTMRYYMRYQAAQYLKFKF